MKVGTRNALLAVAVLAAATISGCTSAGPAHVGVSVNYGYGFGPGYGYGWGGGYRPVRPIGPPPHLPPRPVPLPSRN